MNILLIGPDQHNSTDGVIVQGIRNIFGAVFGEYTSDYVFINDFADMAPEDFLPQKQYDIVAVAGTPWFWDSFHLTPKHRNLLLAFKTHPEAKRVVMGGGSCLSLKDVSGSILERQDEQQALREAYLGATVIVRDSVAKAKLDKAGVPCTLLPCPAYFCYGLTPPITGRAHNSLIWCDPKDTISAVNWQDKEKLGKFHKIIKEFYEEYLPIVYAAKEEDTQSAVDIGLPKPWLIRGWKDTLNIAKFSDVTLSCRVHCAVPAIVAGGDVTLFSFDTRSLVVSDYMGYTMTENDKFIFNPQHPLDLNFYLEEYKRALCGE